MLRLYDSWASTLRLFDASNSVGPREGEEEEGAAPPRLTLIVEGPKRVGKSTFAKFLLNCLLSRYDASSVRTKNPTYTVLLSYERVAYLDTDLGQPEFTTPGILSLNVLDRPVLGKCPLELIRSDEY